MDPVHSFTFILPSTANTVYFPQVLFYFTANKHLLRHYTSNPLFWANQFDWQPHCKLGKVVWLCCVQVPHCCWRRPRAINCLLAPCQKSASNNLQKWFLSPTGRLNFGFILRENLLLCSSYLPLRVSQRVLWDIKTVFWRRCRGERGFLQGESLTSNLFTLLLFCLVSLLYLVYIFLSKIQKN
jgi:hypothetical protein